MNDDRAKYIRAIIRHRVPEATEAELSKFLDTSDRASNPEEMIPASIVIQIMEVIDRMSERQDRLRGPACRRRADHAPAEASLKAGRIARFPAPVCSPPRC